MASEQRVCRACGEKYWFPNGYLPHRIHEKRLEQEKPPIVQETPPPPKISAVEPAPITIKKAHGRPRTQTEEQRKEKWRNYMRSYMAARRAKIKDSETE